MQTFVKRSEQQCHVMRGCVYLGSANVQTQHLSSDLQRLRMEDLSYHPETRLEKKKKKKNAPQHRLQRQATLTNSPKTDPGF